MSYGARMTMDEAELIHAEAEARDDLTAEQKKYYKAWQVEQYRGYSPGEGLVPVFLDSYNPEDSEDISIIDYGCGPGRAGLALSEAGLDVLMLDFVPNALDQAVEEQLGDGLRFLQRDLTQPLDVASEWGYCCDVCEHIPEEDIDKVLDNILSSSNSVFFQISNFTESYGDHPAVKEELHMNVQDYWYWLKKFAEHKGVVRRSNRLYGLSIYMVSRDDSVHV